MNRDKKAKSKTQKQPKEQPEAQSQSITLAEELKIIIRSLNQFLKLYFDTSLNDGQTYANLVKQYFLQESTNAHYSCLISSLFSKISNMLQPFLVRAPVYENANENKLKEEVSVMTHKIQRQTKKIKQLKQQLNKYKEISTKLTNFVYMLRVNNIDVDSLYEKGCREPDRDIQLSRQSNTEVLMQTELSNYQTR